MKYSLFFFLFLFSLPLFAQEGSKDFDFRFGAGRSVLGTGDMRCFIFENEINYRLNAYFTPALAVGYGRSNSGVHATASYLQGNFNIFFSPFKNTGKNDFRIGAGLSVVNMSDTRLVSVIYGSGSNIIVADYAPEVRNSSGFSFILEDTYTIKDKFLLGFKLFTQPYFNGDINSGILLKSGIRL